MVADLEQSGEERAAQIAQLEDQLSAEEAGRLAEAAAAEALRDRLQNADAELTAMTLALEAQRKEAEDYPDPFGRRECSPCRAGTTVW